MEYTGWNNYIADKIMRDGHPYSCGFNGAVQKGLIKEFSNPYGRGHSLIEGNWYVDYCPFCGTRLED